MASLLVNILYVTVIVGTVAASKGHRCFGVNVDATVHRYCCYSTTGHGLPFLLISD